MDDDRADVSLNQAATEWLVTRFIGIDAASGDDSFGELVERRFPDDEALRHVVRIVRGAIAPERFGTMPESAGLRAIIEGCAAAELTDFAREAVFDALLAISRKHVAAGEPLESGPLLDEGTGLPNRTLFLDRLAQAIAFAHRHDTQLAVCLIRFELGQLKDHVPRVAAEIADRLRHTLREIDTVARLGADEFCVVITDVPARGHAEVAIRKLTEIVSEPFDIGERTYAVAAHIGISHYPPHGHDAGTLLEAARDAAAVAQTVSVFGEP